MLQHEVVKKYITINVGCIVNYGVKIDKIDF